MRNWFYIAVILVLTAAVIVVWETPPELLLPGERERPEDRARLFSVVNQAQARHFGETGELSYAFTAERLRHYRHDTGRVTEEDFTTITDPEITLYTENPPWRMRAAAGQLTERGLLLTLSDQVHIWQMDEDAPDDKASELFTDELHVRPQQKVAFTDAPVTIDTPTGTISAVGMKANLRAQHIEFLSEVQGTYDP